MAGAFDQARIEGVACEMGLGFGAHLVDGRTTEDPLARDEAPRLPHPVELALRLAVLVAPAPVLQPARPRPAVHVLRLRVRVRALALNLHTVRLVNLFGQRSISSG